LHSEEFKGFLPSEITPVFAVGKVIEDGKGGGRSTYKGE
jgi:hypothetical protein